MLDNGARWVLCARQPTTWLDEQQVGAGIRIVSVHPDLEISPYERGSIFGPSFELSWEPGGKQPTEGGGTVVRYIGVPLTGPKPLQEASWRMDPADASVFESARLLWGEQLANGNYGEGRLPRELAYPVQSTARRVKLVLKTFVHRETGRPFGHRLLRLEGVS